MYVKLSLGDLSSDLFFLSHLIKILYLWMIIIPRVRNNVVIKYKPTIIAIIINSITLLVANLIN